MYFENALSILINIPNAVQSALEVVTNDERHRITSHILYIAMYIACTNILELDAIARNRIIFHKLAIGMRAIAEYGETH